MAERTGKKSQVLMFNIFRRRNARNDPGGTQAAAVTEDSKRGHTLHLLASGSAGVEGTWQEYLEWNSRGELPCDQLGR